MNTNIQTQNIDIKALLSTLWIFVLFNMLFRDVHEIPTREFLEQAMTGTMNGILITDELLLIGGIMIELLIMMVLFSRVLPYGLNRWANVVVGVFAIATTVMSNRAPDLDDMFFAAIEIVTLVSIIWFAWRWKKQEV